MQVNNFKRINKEDFEEEDQAMIERLSVVLTPFLEQVAAALTKNIDFDNLNQHYTTFTVRQTAGKPDTLTQIKYPLRSRLKGLQVIAAENITDSTPLSAAPFINYTTNGDLITITNVVGIPDGKQFRFSIILIG